VRAMDVMTTAVVTVSPDNAVQDLAKLLSEHGISGVPVVENNRLVGMNQFAGRSWKIRENQGIPLFLPCHASGPGFCP
jgi:predicted transcriptional regulator